ncbi:hypothetical protein Y1Q_0016636 [Alligator mississippiensis]|uniref:Uncharacterized protein n=1 Tax=Alligator mississippiensis TaxID=8496 RepID=A0A151P703_ALLMI|nr:hypothetical protein Y1Q_0016636 [Alligator mississippiensis]
MEEGDWQIEEPLSSWCVSDGVHIGKLRHRAEKELLKQGDYKRLQTGPQKGDKILRLTVQKPVVLDCEL